MDVFIYSDESGVFDSTHNRLFCFGGVLFLSKEEKDICSRKYLHAERAIRKVNHFSPSEEVKAATVSNKEKNKLFRSLNQVEKFGVVVEQQRINPNIFNSKKSKQRYLDYAYKIGIKRKFENLIHSGLIIPDSIDHLHFYVDEHTTATNGKYELKEALEQEFKHGTFNSNYSCFFPPIFPHLMSLELTFCNSSSVTLVRAADIVANKLYHLALTNALEPKADSKFHITILPTDNSWTI